MLSLPPVPVFIAQRAGYNLAFACWATYANVRRATELGLDPLELVLVGTALELSVFLFEVPTGAVADVFGRRLSVVIGHALIGTGLIAETLAGGFAGVLGAQAIWGIGWTFISGARYAWLVDEVGEARAAPVFLRAAQVGQLASLGGIALAVALVPWSLVLPMRIGGAGFLLLALALSLCMGETGFKPMPRAERRTWSALGRTLRDGLREARSHRVVSMLLVVELFLGAAAEGFDRLWQLHLLELVRFSLPSLGPLPSVTWFALIDAGALVLAIPVLEWARRSTSTAGLARLPWLLAALQAVAFASALAFALAQSFALALGSWWLCVVARGTINPLETAWANQQLDSRVRATVLSVLNQASSLGEAGGGPCVGALGRSLGLRPALALASGLTLPALALFTRAALRQVNTGTLLPR